ncbi:hypothetical protein B0T20DRAFT_213607 [Sordaria brevicollis]|uniref:Uncharacterized protein n=1 Tax=Sordaria brevicollis TaxID=83679 RepID=A0AAE0PER4_SORBR|nr:hypothetical protein B0T20DRAFT_213607 [Sordaria brevicollis]
MHLPCHAAHLSPRSIPVTRGAPARLHAHVHKTGVRVRRRERKMCLLEDSRDSMQHHRRCSLFSPHSSHSKSPIASLLPAKLSDCRLLSSAGPSIGNGDTERGRLTPRKPIDRGRLGFVIRWISPLRLLNKNVIPSPSSGSVPVCLFFLLFSSSPPHFLLGLFSLFAKTYLPPLDRDWTKRKEDPKTSFSRLDVSNCCSSL